MLGYLVVWFFFNFKPFNPLVLDKHQPLICFSPCLLALTNTILKSNWEVLRGLLYSNVLSMAINTQPRQICMRYPINIVRESIGRRNFSASILNSIRLLPTTNICTFTNKSNGRNRKENPHKTNHNQIYQKLLSLFLH